MPTKSFCLNLVVCLLFPGISLAAQPTLPKAPYVPPQTVRQWQEEGKVFTFVDVRESDEYKAGHLDGAINISYLQVEKKVKAKKFDKSQTYVFYCTYSSWRAPYAANTLADFGFANVYVLEGGAAAWQSGGQVIYASGPGDQARIIPYSKSLPKIFHHPRSREYKEKIHLTRKQLSDFDGQDGRPAYVAVNGTIYDLTSSRLWRGGTHDPSHGHAKAGQDLTEVIKDSPHGEKHLKNFPAVGWLVEKEM